MNYITLNLYWISLLEPLNSVLPSHSFPLTPSQLFTRQCVLEWYN